MVKLIWPVPFGMEACKHYYSVRYVRLPDLLLDLQFARDNRTSSTCPEEIYEANSTDP